MLRPLHELPAIRAWIWHKPPCVWADHVWLRFGEVDESSPLASAVIGPLVIAVICHNCGRTPLEALGALPVRDVPVD